jgi:exopolysaccharide biosynthesis polyprenyl glycosylphosphotransferase
LGDIDLTYDIITGRGIKEVIVAPSPTQEERLLEMVYRMQLLPVNIRVVPQYVDLLFLHANLDTLGGVPLITLKEPSLNSFQRIVKRGFDLIMGLLLLPVLLPVMAVIAASIRLSGPGPIIFAQERLGEGRKPFTMYKFRTMVKGAERRVNEVLETDSFGNMRHKHPNDPRVTPVGRFLRRYSLDELPQIFNVLRGDMSLVGPRPEMPWLVDLYDDWQHVRFEVPQGVTGWWQVTRGEESLMHLNTDADLYYIRNYSILLDLRILMMTISAVIVGRGAY